MGLGGSAGFLQAGNWGGGCKTDNSPCAPITGPSTANTDPWPCQELRTQGLGLETALGGHGHENRLPGEQTQEARQLTQARNWTVEHRPEVKGV